ncbi:MAG: PRC-barrel domain-containing protein [Haliea sp.]
MKKLHSYALCALVTPVITLGAGSVLAHQANDQDIDRKHQSSQQEQGATRSSTGITQSDQGVEHHSQSKSQKAMDHRDTRDQSHMGNRGYMDSVPAKGMQASNLIGTKVKTTVDKDVGAVSDLIIDESGQVVAIVVGVGGFLGMGEKDVAIGWDHVTQSGTSAEHELQVDLTREDLRSAPEFETQDQLQQ